MHRLLALAARQHGVVTLAQALALGVTKHQLATAVARGVLRRHAAGVFVVAGAPATRAQVLYAEVAAAGDGAVASHQAAARLWQFRTRMPDRLAVTLPAGRAARLRVAALHTTDFLPEHHVTSLDGIPVTSAARTVLDVCGRHPFVHDEQRAKRFVDDALLSRAVSLHDLRRVLAETAARGRNGAGVLRSIITELGDGYVPTESELEDLVLAVLAAAGLPLPVRQAEIGGTVAPIGRFDFYYALARLVIEADSEAHHGGWAQQERDRERDMRLAALGIMVVRPTWTTLQRRPRSFVDAVRARLLLTEKTA